MTNPTRLFPLVSIMAMALAVPMAVDAQTATPSAAAPVAAPLVQLPDFTRLVEQVTGRVRWRESVAAMAQAGVTDFVELGGKVLGPMVKRIVPDATVTSVVAMDDIEALVAAL